jgi:DNA-binding response OmpR family regulator
MTKKKILTIDDDHFYEQLYRDIFGGACFQVQHAFDQVEGLAMLESFHPDLVTLDVMMPEKQGMVDGFGFLELMRQNAASANIPVIMISALSEPSDIKRGRDLGATKYIPKQNMVPNELVKEVKKLLGLK